MIFVDKELINYISRGRGAGVLDDELRDVLLDAGWPLEEVNQALVLAGSHLPIINSGSLPIETSFEWTSGHRRVFLVVVIAISMVLIGAIGVFARQFYLDRHSPERVTIDVLKTVSGISGFDYDGSLELNVNYQSSVVGNSTSSVELPNTMINEIATTTVAFSGRVFTPEAGRPSFSWQGRVNVDRLNNDIFKADVEFRLIEDALYVFLSDVSRLPLLDLSSLVGFWLSITPADMANFDVGSSITAPSANQLLGWRNAIAQSKSFRLVERLGEEKINNINTVKYSFSLNLVDAKKLLDRLSTIPGSEGWSGQVDTLSDQDVIVGEVWIGKADNLPYKVSVQADLKGGNIEDETGGHVDLVINFNQFNGGLSVVAPTGHRSLSGLMESLVGTGTASNVVD